MERAETRDAADGDRPSAKAVGRWTVFLVILAAVCAAISLARRPPVLDLAQQLDQVHLLGEVLRGDRPDLTIEWLAPNRLGYIPLLAAYQFASVDWAPRVALMLLAAVWLGSLHAMAASTERTLATVTLASTLLFTSSFYAGFFNFLVAMAGIAYWTWALRGERRRRPFLWLLATSVCGVLLLNAAHGLALAIVGFSVATTVLLWKFRPPEVLARALAVVLVVPAAAWFGARLSGRAWQSTMQMQVSPWDRVSSLDTATTLVFGGLRGRVEVVLLLALLLWVGLGAARAIDERGRGVEPFLVISGSVFLLVAVLAPDKVDKTIFFAWRWGAPAFACLLLGLPEPRLRGRTCGALAAGALVLQLSATARAWRAFDRTEMDGFEECLAAIPPGARLLSLDWQLTSPRFRVEPYLHMGVYASIERGAMPDFSFVDYASSLVLRHRREETRIAGDFLARNPRWARPAHLAGRTHVLVHGAEPIARAYEQQTDLLRVLAGDGDWHLLEVLAEPGRTRPEDPP